MKLSGDEYMALLEQRQAEFVESQRRAAEAAVTDGGRPILARFPPLLTWFIRDGDEDLVEIPDPPAKRCPEPRYYRPAAWWRARITEIESNMVAVARRADVGDRAAAGGCSLGPKRTARQQKRADAALERYAVLQRRLSHAQAMLRSAEHRESAD